MNITRRGWMQGALLAAARLKGPLGIQLYTVRSVLPKDPEGVYRALAKIGYREMEGRLSQIEGHVPLLAELGLQWTNWMIPTSVITGNWTLWQQMMKSAGAPSEAVIELPQLIETAKQYGVRNCGISYLLPQERLKLPSVIDQLNKTGEAFKKAGIAFYYHNHAWEFEGEAGKRPFDMLLARLGPDVKFEVDVFWAAVSGQDPVKLLRALKGRVISMHLKDVAKDAPVAYKEMEVAHSTFRDAGDGRLNWPDLLAAAQSAGVHHYFVEQDYPAGDPIESARKGYQFLRSVQ